MSRIAAIASRDGPLSQYELVVVWQRVARSLCLTAVGTRHGMGKRRGTD